MLVRDLAGAAQPSLFIPLLPALLPRLLGAAAEQEVREVAAAADEALEALLARSPPQSCLGLLAPHLPAPGAALAVDRAAGARLHAAIRGLHRVARRMQPAGLGAHLQPALVPGLCAAYSSPLSDVRKATVDCLVAICQVRVVMRLHCALVHAWLLHQTACQCAHTPRRHSSPVQVVGEATLRPHLAPLTASQRRLLDIFIERAQAGA